MQCIKHLNCVVGCHARAKMGCCSLTGTLEKIGGGGLSSVYSAMYNGKHVAVKHLRLLQDCSFVDDANFEASITYCIKHENIIRLHDMIHQPVPGVDPLKPEVDIFMIFDRMDMSLRERINANWHSGDSVATEYRATIMQQVLRALETIHSYNLVHRDVKTDNILVNKDYKTCVCDFGSCERIDNGRLMWDWSTGTPWYRSPEICMCEDYSRAIDVWGCGCVFAELIIGYPLFYMEEFKDADRQGDDHMLRKISRVVGAPSTSVVDRVKREDIRQLLMAEQAKPSEPSLPHVLARKGATPDEIDLITRMLTFDDQERITCTQALAHALFK